MENAIDASSCDAQGQAGHQGRYVLSYFSVSRGHALASAPRDTPR